MIDAGRLLAAGSPGEILSRLDAGRRVAVRFLDGTSDEFPVADEAEQAALLQRLLADGKEIVEFTVVAHDLEDLFLKITEGIVQ